MTEQTQSKHVLLIEDHPDIAELMIEMLDRLGHRVTHARSRAEALKSIQQQDFDVLLVDYRLPDGDGAQLLREALAMRPVRAILLSAHDAEVMRPHMAAGFMACMVKPVEMEDLQHTIDSVCRRSPPQG